jgi:hypothetical protein
MRPSTGLLFILQMIYEHGEQWWNDVCRGKLVIRPPERSLVNLSAEQSSSKSGGSGRRKLWILSIKYLFHARNVLKYAVKSYDTGPTALLPSQESRSTYFYRPRPGLNLRTLGPMVTTVTSRPTTGATSSGVGRRLLNAAPRWVHVGFVVDKLALGQGFPFNNHHIPYRAGFLKQRYASHCSLVHGHSKKSKDRNIYFFSINAVT